MVLLGTCGALAADPMPGWVLHQPADIQWRAAQNLPPGAMVAVLEGDPAQAGFFTMRIKVAHIDATAWMPPRVAAGTAGPTARR